MVSNRAVFKLDLLDLKICLYDAKFYIHLSLIQLKNK